MRCGQIEHLLTLIAMLKHTIMSAGAIAFCIIITTPSFPSLRGPPLRLVALLLGLGGQSGHLHPKLLAQLLELPHRLHRVAWVEGWHWPRGAARCEGRRIRASGTGVRVWQLRRRTGPIQIQVAFIPSRATSAARLLERPPPLCLVSAARRIEVTTIVEASLARASCGSGRKGRSVRRWGPEEGLANGGSGGRFRWRVCARDVGLVFNGLDEIVRKAFRVCKA